MSCSRRGKGNCVDARAHDQEPWTKHEETMQHILFSKVYKYNASCLLNQYLRMYQQINISLIYTPTLTYIYIHINMGLTENRLPPESHRLVPCIFNHRTLGFQSFVSLHLWPAQINIFKQSKTWLCLNLVFAVYIPSGNLRKLSNIAIHSECSH